MYFYKIMLYISIFTAGWYFPEMIGGGPWAGVKMLACLTCAVIVGILYEKRKKEVYNDTGR